jgi:uncharacterized membrane protein YcgQ (UPF0703/DUF1980 family)
VYPQQIQALAEPIENPMDSDVFFPVQQFQKSPQRIKEEQLLKKQAELEKKEQMLESQYKQQLMDKKQQRHVNQNERMVISDEDWNEFKRFQQQRYERAIGRRLSSVEGFTSVNDEFNDVLLFALLGVFFLVFTDYVYKLGRKSY